MQAVTGAFSYTGGYIARELLARGQRVRTLSRRREPGHSLSERVEFAQLQFDDPDALTAALDGVHTLYNTYWVRFPRGAMAWADVLWNTRTLLHAARRAGVQRIVQLSVSNCSERSPLPYYRMKALAERELRCSGVSHAIVRPTLIFGAGDILINNIAWVLRRLPVFAVAGSGRYRVQPVAAEEVARLAVQAAGDQQDVVLDAAGPRAYEFAELVALVRSAMGSRARVVHVPAPVAVALAGAAGFVLRDALLTRPELDGVMAELLFCDAASGSGPTLEDWLAAHRTTVGRSYVSERRRNWPSI